MFKLPVWLLMLLSPVMRFTPANEKELAQLNPGFAWRVRVWMWMCWTYLGLEIVIIDGLRTAAEQLALHKADPRNPATGGSHQAGKAVDVRVKRDGVVVLLKGNAAASWKAVYALAEDCGILNGSTFTGYPDNNHFYIK